MGVRFAAYVSYIGSELICVPIKSAQRIPFHIMWIEVQQQKFLLFYIFIGEVKVISVL